MRLPVTTNGQVDFSRAIPQIQKARDLGVNFFDTMEDYYGGQSEEAIGKAIQGNRFNYIIQSKLGSWPDQINKYEERFNNILRRLNTDYLDILICHNLHWDYYTKYGMRFLELTEKLIQKGKLRYRGFSSHDGPENLERILREKLFDSVILQYNLIDQKWGQCLNLAYSLGIGTVVMGPIGGGRLSRPIPELSKLPIFNKISMHDMALKFVLDNENVDVALSGMESTQYLEDNIKLTNSKTITLKNHYETIKGIMDHKKEVADLYCTGCLYCRNCPHGVDIAKVMEYYIADVIYGLKDWARGAYAALGGKASNCHECTLCEQKCPQHLEIIKNLKEAHKKLS